MHGVFDDNKDTSIVICAWSLSCSESKEDSNCKRILCVLPICENPTFGCQVLQQFTKFSDSTRVMFK